MADCLSQLPGPAEHATPRQPTKGLARTAGFRINSQPGELLITVRIMRVSAVLSCFAGLLVATVGHAATATKDPLYGDPSHPNISGMWNPEFAYFGPPVGAPPAPRPPAASSGPPRVVRRPVGLRLACPGSRARRRRSSRRPMQSVSRNGARSLKPARRNRIRSRAAWHSASRGSAPCRWRSSRRPGRSR